MSLITKQTATGQQVVVGDLPQDFLRVTSPAQSPEQQQINNDEMTARMLQSQQMAYGGMQGMPTNVTGRLSVTLAQAKLNKNYGLTKMDPYLRIRIGHAVFETPTASNGAKNPRWNKTVQCYLPKGVDSAYIEIFDEKTFQGDDRVAWAHITIPEIALNGEVVDDWYPLSGKLGEGKEGMVNLVFSFNVIQAAPAVQPQMNPQVVMIPGAPAMYPTFQPGYQPVIATQPMMQPMVVPAAFPAQAQASQPRPAAQLSEDDLNQIKDMFPNTEMEVIKSVAEAQRGNKDSTINALLTMNA
ncbi:toll-interacting protein-like [Watersipora subatra]|uniref:toll-interacting protein-like n=1 Tax=Watersipora subatra TaxID=2589382 RepID=UPI00355B63E7